MQDFEQIVQMQVLGDSIESSVPKLDSADRISIIPALGGPPVRMWLTCKSRAQVSR